MAREQGASMSSILDKAVEMYRRQCFLEAANRQFAELRQDAQAWKEEQEERAAWQAVGSDSSDFADPPPAHP